MVSKSVVLRISDNVCVDLDGVKLRSRNEVADALEKVRVEHPDATIFIEADDSGHYEAIGKAIYGSHQAGFSGDRLRILVEGKILYS